MLGHTEHQVQGQNRDLSSYETFGMEHFDTQLVHIRTHRDTSYQFQSYGWIDVWNRSTLSWNRLCDLLPHEVTNEYDAAELLRTLGLLILWGEDPR